MVRLSYALIGDFLFYTDVHLLLCLSAGRVYREGVDDSFVGGLAIECRDSYLF